jgi:hypothetical protein
VIDSVRGAYFLGVIEGSRAVTVGEDENVRWREDLQSRFKCGSNKSGRLVAGDQECSVSDIVLDLGLGSGCSWRRVLLEKDEKRSKSVARGSSVGCGNEGRW